MDLDRIETHLCYGHKTRPGDRATVLDLIERIRVLEEDRRQLRLRIDELIRPGRHDTPTPPPSQRPRRWFKGRQ